MRKIYCLEKDKPGFDNLPFKEIEDMAGSVFPDGDKWEVTLLDDGCGFTCDTQENAYMIANQEMIIGMLKMVLKQKDTKKLLRQPL
jgi:hypothetical protein